MANDGVPEAIPNTKFGSNFDGHKFRFFESDEERINYIKSLPGLSLEDVKINKCLEIDNKTSDLIFSGITYKGVLLSMSLTAQTNYLGLLNVPENRFPIPMVSKDDRSYVLILNNIEAMELYDLAWAKVADNKISGGQLKLRINSISNIDDINNFKDTR